MFISAAHLIPAWYNPVDNTSWWEILFLGKADYHLYFIPMIFQLYLLFPFLRFAMRKISPTVVLILAFVIQMALYIHISEGLSLGNSDFFFRKDQQQYIIAFSWIGYFALGMWLATVKMWQAVQNNWVKFSISVLFAASVFLLISQSILAIENLVDPITALRFTRLPVLFFSSISIIALFQLSANMRLNKRVVKSMVRIGEVSFLLYLSHTLVLRMFALGYRGIFSSQDLLVAAGLLGIGLLVSLSWMNFQKKKR